MSMCTNSFYNFNRRTTVAEQASETLNKIEGNLPAWANWFTSHSEKRTIYMYKQPNPG